MTAARRLGDAAMLVTPLIDSAMLVTRPRAFERIPASGDLVHTVDRVVAVCRSQARS